MMKKRYLLSLCMAVLLAVELQAKVVLPALLCDNMVVQQNSVVCLWGKSDASVLTVKPSWTEKEYRTDVSGNGSFQLRIETPSAGGPFEIEFNDGEKTTVRNVMAGEVWICAGQSNMDMPMSGYPGQPVNGALEAVVEAKEYPVHVFMVNRKLSKQTEEQCEGKWEAPSAESVMHSSATAYFYAKNLQKSLQVPVGIIVSAWGGTSILSWMSEKSVNTLPSDVTKACVERDSREQNLPGRLFNAMIHPLKNYTAKGFIWYQGEHNLQEHLTYDVMMKTMVDEWRNSWNDKKNEMPFYFVQIAPYRYFNNSMEIQRPLIVEAQKRALELIPNSGMATTTDIGEEFCIHPAKKPVVGLRLAACALAGTYHVKGLCTSDIKIEEIKPLDNKMILKFNSDFRSVYPARMKGFEIAGKDRKFYPAEAVFKNGTIEVRSDSVAHPEAVRYAFRNYVEADMKNVMGVAASSFRTDNWNE
mgnify:FL=1